MAHNASDFYPPADLYGDSPAETAALVGTAVAAARSSYDSSEKASAQAYAEVTNVAPVISALSPASFSVAPSTPCSLQVVGTGFDATSIVKVGGVDRTTTFTSATRLTATFNAPASTSTVDVMVVKGARNSNVVRLLFAVALKKKEV